MIKYAEITNQDYQPGLPTRITKKRLNLDLSEVARKNLEELKVATDADSMSEVIRRSLNLYDLVISAKKDDPTVVIRAKNGTERVLEFL